MEIKMMTVTADDGEEYQVPVFRDSDDVQTQIDAATKDLQEQLTAAQAAKEEALASVETAREEGREEGLSAGREECAGKYFEAVFTGDGGTSVTLEGCRFDPDFVTVRCFSGGWDNYVEIDQELALKFWAYDKQGTDKICGVGYVRRVGGNANVPDNAHVAKSDGNAACASWDAATNTLTISDLVSGAVKSVFGNGLVYRVLALKTEDEA